MAAEAQLGFGAHRGNPCRTGRVRQGADPQARNSGNHDDGDYDSRRLPSQLRMSDINCSISDLTSPVMGKSGRRAIPPK